MAAKCYMFVMSRTGTIATLAVIVGACSSGSTAPKQQCTDTSRDVQAKNYNQSCESDSDCVGVGIGYACECETVFCVTTAINASAYAQWKSDVGYAQYMSDVASYPDLAICGCPMGVVGASGSMGNACCGGGTCQGCPSPSSPPLDLALDAATEASPEAADDAAGAE
ncbi:MAG: hypothetical protein ACLP1X_08105 [Polyangiaceae bacterium]